MSLEVKVTEAIEKADSRKLAKLLTDDKLNINWKNDDGSGSFVHQVIKSALRRAMLGDGGGNSVSTDTYVAMTKLILEAGCSCVIENSKGQTPLDVIRTVNLPEKQAWVELLETFSEEAGVTPRGKRTSYEIGRKTIALSASSDTKKKSDKPKKARSFHQSDFQASLDKLAQHQASRGQHGASRPPLSPRLKLPLSIETKARSQSVSAGPTFLNKSMKHLRRGDAIGMSQTVVHDGIRSAQNSRPSSPRSLNVSGGVPQPELKFELPTLQLSEELTGRSPRSAVPPLTLGLGALLSPRLMHDEAEPFDPLNRMKKKNRKTKLNQSSTDASFDASAHPPPPLPADPSSNADDDDDNHQDDDGKPHRRHHSHTHRHQHHSHHRHESQSVPSSPRRAAKSKTKSRK